MPRWHIALIALGLLLTPVGAFAQPRERVSHCPRRLTYFGVFEGMALPVAGTVDPVVEAQGRRRLEALRARVRDLESITFQRDRAVTILARLRRLQHGGCLLVLAVEKVAEARNVSLTTEALVLMGRAFEHIAEQADGLWNLLEVAEEPEPPGPRRYCEVIVRPAPPVALPSPEALRETRAFLEETALRIRRLRTERVRRYGTISSAENLSIHDNAEASRKCAIIGYATAFHLARQHAALTPIAWRAVDRLSSNEISPMVEQALEYQRVVPSALATTLRTMHVPGEALLETASTGVVALAPP